MIIYMCLFPSHNLHPLINGFKKCVVILQRHITADQVKTFIHHLWNESPVSVLCNRLYVLHEKIIFLG